MLIYISDDEFKILNRFTDDDLVKRFAMELNLRSTLDFRMLNLRIISIDLAKLATVKSFNFADINFRGQNVLNMFARVEICDKSHESQHSQTHAKQTPSHNVYMGQYLVSFSSSEELKIDPQN